MINTLRAVNFKSWKDTGELKLAPLTGFFGSNSSGKTSLLQILLLMKQTVESSDRKRVLHAGDEKTYIDLGTFYDLIYSHNIDNELGISLEWTLPKKKSIKNPEEKQKTLFEIQNIKFDTFIKEDSGKLTTPKFQYKINGHTFGLDRKKDNHNREEYDLHCTPYRATRTPGRVWPLPSPIKCYGFPDQVNGYYKNVSFLSDIVLEFETLFSQMLYLGPLRENPKRIYTWAGLEPSDVGRKGELAPAALLAAKNKGAYISPGYKKRKRKLDERIAQWLIKMGMIHSFSLQRIAENRKEYELRIKKTKSSPEVLITDVGFGVSQVLPVLVLCYYAPEHSILLFEQPEIHLHPSVQACLADIFIDAVANRKVQIIVESHSEYFLQRLQRRIAEEKIKSGDTALYFCEMEKAQSKIDKLDVDLYGNIKNWPQDFFGDEMGEMRAMTEAMIKRQKEQR